MKTLTALSVAATLALAAPATALADEGSTAGGAIGGAAVGAAIGGPVGAIIGAGVGAGVGATIDPPARVTTYVEREKVEPVRLRGEVVVGAGLPDVVTLHPVPDYEYHYAYVNGQRVLVDPGTRRIVYVY